MKTPIVLVALSLSIVGQGMAEEFRAESNDQLARLAGRLKPGDTVVLAGGPFSGVHLSGLRGEEGKPITLRGESAERPAPFRGGASGLHLSACQHVMLRFLDVRGASANGINIDDGGNKAEPAVGIMVVDCSISDIGPRGNKDGLKMSGVDRFGVRRCRFEGWGGSAIDMVGCHEGMVEGCTFLGKDGFSQANAVQMKGGSARISVRLCFFKDAGQRAINLGGSTGLDYFRPKVGDYEAEDIEVAGNRFVGGMAAIAWVGSRGGHVHHNTIYKPDKWVMRILQENQGEGFKPASGGIFEDNLIVFDRRVSVFANVGGGTAPESFVFRRNAWFDADGRDRKPSLPIREIDGVFGIDPKLIDPGGSKMSTSSIELKGKGVDGYRSGTR